MRKVKFIYNPSSGETLIAERLDEIVALYQQRGFSLLPYRLTFDGRPEDLLFDLDDSYHHVLIAGGDGTVNYVVNNLKKEGLDLPVAVLPAGTANDFASMLGVRSSDIVKNCARILDGEIREIDLGRVNGEYFVNVFSCGLFTDVSQKTPTILKNTFGKLAYYVGGVGELQRFRKMHIRIESDGGNFDGNSIIFFVFNGQTAGKLRIAYLSEPDDGLLDVLIVKGDNPLETLQTVFQYVSRMRTSKAYPAGVVHIRCRSLRALCDTLEPTDMDGQAGPDFPLEITCEQSGIRVLCPRRR